MYVCVLYVCVCMCVCVLCVCACEGGTDLGLVLRPPRQLLIHAVIEPLLQDLELQDQVVDDPQLVQHVLKHTQTDRRAGTRSEIAARAHTYEDCEA